MSENTVVKDKKVFRMIPVDAIFPNPNQPRKCFDAEEITGLAQSIRAVGIIQPLSVCYDKDGTYRLIAGERRLRACRMLGMPAVPCIVTDAEEEEVAVLALVENLQRKDLDFFEQAEGISAIMDDQGMSQSEIAVRLGKSQSSVANKLRLLKIPQTTRDKVRSHGLSERHARALLRLPAEAMGDAAMIAAEKKMKIDDFERYIEKVVSDSDGTVSGIMRLMKKTPPPKAKGYIGDMRVCKNTIERAVKMLRSAGIKASSQDSEFEDKVVFTITIKK